MPTRSPIFDTWNLVSNVRWWPALLFDLMLLGSLAVAIAVWRSDRSQRTGAALSMWLVRLALGSLWYSQTLWKLPPDFGGPGGLELWMRKMVTTPAFAWHGAFVERVILPNFTIFAWQVYFGELFIAITLISGLWTRAGGLLGTVMALNLYLGLYAVPNEWAWAYVMLVGLNLLVLAYGGRRSLGVDAFIRSPSEGQQSGIATWLIRLATA